MFSTAVCSSVLQKSAWPLETYSCPSLFAGLFAKWVMTSFSKCETMQVVPLPQNVDNRQKLRTYFPKGKKELQWAIVKVNQI